MAKNDAKRREKKRSSLLHTRLRLEEAREKGHGVNFTSYMKVEEYEPQLIEEELSQACVELNVLNDMIQRGCFSSALQKQVNIIYSLIRPRGYIQTLKSKYNVGTIPELKGRELLP